MRRFRVVAAFAAILFSLSLAPDVLAKGGVGSSGSSSGRSYSSSSSSSSSSSRSYSTPSAPSRTYSAPTRTYTAPTPVAPPKITQRTYTAPATNPIVPRGDRGIGTASAKPVVSGFDSGAANALKKQQSQQKFQTANKPPTVNTAPNASTRPAGANNYTANNSYTRSNRDLRHELRDVKMENRALRQDRYYGNYYHRPVPGYAHYGYHDPFGNVFFWMWLMDSSNQRERDMWMYNHQQELDSARYDQLRREDVDLERRLAALEAKGVAKDPNYVPKGMDPDLVYSDTQVKEAQQPAAPAPVAAPLATSAPAGSNENSGHFWFWFFGLLTVGGVVYLVFFKKWETR